MISIIIPTLNEGGFLKQTLQTLYSMKQTEFECIISDGRSKDETQAIAKKYTDKIIIYTGTARQTIAHARNLGAKYASGDYLVFIDADVTIPNPDSFFKSTLQAFEINPNLTAVTTRVHVAKGQALTRDNLLYELLNATYYCMNNIIGLGAATGEFQMIRRSSFEQVGGYNERLVAYEDNEIFVRLAKIGKTRLLPHLTIFHSGRRVHKVGHLKLLSIWIANGIWVTLFNRALNKEWKPIR